jgi:transcriptional regulator with XRE-family HTH domain
MTRDQDPPRTQTNAELDVAAERTRRGWTQEELAARIGVSARTISNWEAGKPVPRTRLLALERAFTSPLQASPLSDVETRALVLELLRRVDLRATL